MMRLWVPLLFMLMASPAVANNFFNYKADDNQTSISPFGNCDAAKTLTIDTGDKVEGTGSMKSIIVGSSQSQLACQLLNGYTLSPTVAWDSGKIIYMRWWMKIDSGFDWGERVPPEADPARAFWMKAGRWGDTTNPNYTEAGLTQMLHPDKINIFECHQCDGAGPPDVTTVDNVLTVNYDFDPVTNAAVSSWHEYIFAIHLQNGTASDAFGEFFIDGGLAGSGGGGTGTSSTSHLMECGGSNPCGNIEAAGWSMWGQSFYPQLCAEGIPCPTRGGGDAGGSIWTDDISMDDVFNSNFSAAQAATLNGASVTGGSIQ